MELKLGKPCKKAGHHRGDGLNWRMRHNGVCLECHREHNRERSKKPEVRIRNNQATRKYRLVHPDKARAFAADWQRRKIEQDPYFKLVRNIRGRIRRALKAGYKKDQQYGIDYDAIARHVGPRPGPDYHLDHIIPINQFDLSDWNQVLRACAPENHRWLRAEKNLRRPKDGRDAGPVQHCLPIGLLRKESVIDDLSQAEPGP